MGLGFGNSGLANLYGGSASPRQLQRLLKARITSMMAAVLTGAAAGGGGPAAGADASAALLGDLGGNAADAATEAVERLATVVGLPEGKLERLYEEQLQALMSGQLDASAGAGGGLFGGGFGGKAAGMLNSDKPMDQKALKELVPVLTQLQALVDAGQIDDSMLKQLKKELTNQGASLPQIIQVRGGAALACAELVFAPCVLVGCSVGSRQSPCVAQGETARGCSDGQGQNTASLTCSPLDARAPSPALQAMDLLADEASDAPELPAEMKTAEMRVTFKKLGQMLRKMDRL